MSKTDKLKAKLKNRSIKAKELVTLLKKLGWTLRDTEGSHQQWVNGVQRFTLATHDKDLKPYQIKEAQEKLGLQDEKDDDKKD